MVMSYDPQHSAKEGAINVAIVFIVYTESKAWNWPGLIIQQLRNHVNLPKKNHVLVG